LDYRCFESSNSQGNVLARPSNGARAGEFANARWSPAAAIAAANGNGQAVRLAASIRNLKSDRVLQTTSPNRWRVCCPPFDILRQFYKSNRLVTFEIANFA
jgi:hypothetical protein